MAYYKVWSQEFHIAKFEHKKYVKLFNTHFYFVFSFRNSNRGGSRSTNRGNSSYGRARTVYRKPTRESSGVTRPAAMHVDDYQKAEEADSDHEKGIFWVGFIFSINFLNNIQTQNFEDIFYYSFFEANFRPNGCKILKSWRRMLSEKIPIIYGVKFKLYGISV